MNEKTRALKVKKFRRIQEKVERFKSGESGRHEVCSWLIVTVWLSLLRKREKNKGNDKKKHPRCPFYSIFTASKVSKTFLQLQNLLLH